VLRPGIDVLLLGIELHPMPEKWSVQMPPRSAHVTNDIAAQKFVEHQYIIKLWPEL